MTFKLIETILYTKQDGLLRLQLHYNRLSSSLNYFSYPPLTYQKFESELLSYISSIEGIQNTKELVVKVEVDNSGVLEFSNRAAPAEIPEIVNVVLDKDLTKLNSIEFLVNKTTNRDIYNEARLRNGVDGKFGSIFDVILINEHDEVMESSIMNVIIQLPNEEFWFTPPISSGCLPGVKRQELINCGILKERIITKDELINCYKEGGNVQLINSVRGRYNVKIIF